MLALIGVATIVALTVAILSNRASPVVALILIPVVAALIERRLVEPSVIFEAVA